MSNAVIECHKIEAVDSALKQHLHKIDAVTK